MPLGRVLSSLLTRIFYMDIQLKRPLLWVLIITLWSTPLTAFGQANQQQKAPVRKSPKVTFSQNMTLAKSELGWSKTYYQSFKKTKEAVYLKLAATHCANAVKVLKATQTGLPNTTRFYYKAKNQRYSTCRFFEQLQETALRLPPEHHIGDLPDHGCDF